MKLDVALRDFDRQVRQDSRTDNSIDTMTQLTGINFRFTEDTLRAVEAVKYVQGILQVHGAGLVNIVFDSGSYYTGSYSIALDASALKEENYLEILAGLGLHEAGHKMYSQWLFQHTDFMHNSQFVKSLYNIVEDSRIEMLVCKESPGFARYVGHARQFKIEEILASMKKQWDEADDYVRAFITVTCYYLAPNNKINGMDTLEIKGQNVIEYLQNLAPMDTSDDVIRIVRALRDLLQQAEEQAEEKDRDNSEDTSDEQKEDGEQSENNSNEQSDETSEDQSDDSGASSDEKSQDQSDSGSNNNSDDSTDSKQDGNSESSDDADENSDKDTQKQQGSGGNANGDTMNVDDMVKQLREALEECEGDISSDEQEQLDRLVQCNMVAKQVTGGGNIIIMDMQKDEIGREIVQFLKKDTLPAVRKLRQSLTLRLADTTVRSMDKTSGRLARKRLANAQVSDRLFYTQYKMETTGMSLCVLLDQSGSMGSISNVHSMKSTKYNKKIVNALKTGYVIQQALEGLPKSDLFIYSHTSEGRSCTINRIYNPTNLHNSDIIGSFRDGNGNFDAPAIVETFSEFRRDSKYAKKVMIVVSDGQPNAFTELNAYNETRKAVQWVEKQGAFIMQVAIDSVNSSKMFSHYVTFTDVNKMVADMSNLITKIAVSKQWRV